MSKGKPSTDALLMNAFIDALREMLGHKPLYSGMGKVKRTRQYEVMTGGNLGDGNRQLSKAKR